MVKKKPEGEELMFLAQYLERLLNCELWIDKAEELLAGARALEAHVRNNWDIIEANFKEGRYSEGGETPTILPLNLQGLHFMLVAYALENFLKAVIIEQEKDRLRDQVSSTRKLPKIIEGHNLVALTRAAGLAIDVGEEDLLTRLCWNSVWAGRYPVPVDCGGLRNVKVYSDGRGYLIAYFSSEDVDRLNTLVERVRTHVRSILPGSGM